LRIRFPSLPRLNRDAALLIAAAGLIAVSFFGIQMLLKVLYVIRLGYGPEYVGWYNGTGALFFMLMGIPSGALGVRYDTRKVMLAGAGGVVLGQLLLPLTEFAPTLLRTVWPFLSQLCLTVGWSMFTVNLVPSLTAVTAPENRATALAISSMLSGLGTFVGTLIGGMLPGWFAAAAGLGLDDPAPYRRALFVGAALALTCLVPLSLIRKAGSHRARQHRDKRSTFPWLAIGLVIAYVYVRHAGWATCQAFCNAYMDTELHLPASAIGLITGIGQFVAIFAPMLAPRLAARYGYGRTLVGVSIGTALCLLPLALIPHWFAAAVGRFGILVLSGIWLPALQTFQMGLVDDDWRSMAYGALTMGMGMGFSSTSLSGGYIIAAWGYDTLFLLGAALSLASAILMWGILRSPAVRPHREPDRQPL